MDDAVAPIVMSLVALLAISAVFGGLIWAAVMDGRDQAAGRVR